MDRTHTSSQHGDQGVPLSMSELASIRGGQNIEFVLWVLKKRQAAEEMANFFANQNAH